MNGEPCDLRAALTIQLAEDSMHVVLHGGDADAARVGDLFVGISGNDELADLPLPERQDRIRICARRTGRTRRHPRRHGPCRDEAQGDVQLVERRARPDEDRLVALLQLATPATDRTDDHELAADRMRSDRRRDDVLWRISYHDV